MNRPKIVLLFLFRSVGLFKLSRWLTRSQLRILCYHAGCVGDESHYNPKLFCSAPTFRARMRWLQERGFGFVNLDSAVNALAAGGPTPRLPVVVTFDDGWSTTARRLVPVLGEMNVPSTLYLCTRHFVEGWPVLDVAVRYAIWKFKGESVLITNFDPGVDGSYCLRTRESRDLLASRVVAAIQATATGRTQVCSALGRFAAFGRVAMEQLELDSGRFEYLSAQELAALPAMGCSVELHGHDHHYPVGEPGRFREDLQRCSVNITALGLPQPQHYCYPSGSFDGAASAVLSELGIKSATTCLPGLCVSGQASPHYLPRFLDGEDVHVLEFEAEVSGFSELVRRALVRWRLMPAPPAHP